MIDQKRIEEYEDCIKRIEENLVKDIALGHNIGRPLNSCAAKSLYLGDYLIESIRIVEEMKEV